jgi:hypothetical protein
MQSRSNFWLTLNDLAEEVMLEGDTPVQRSANLAAVFHALSPTSQAVYRANARIVLAALAPLADVMESTEVSRADSQSRPAAISTN